MLTHASALAASLGSKEVAVLASRAVSSKYPRPKPRKYDRRLFEAVVAPILPRTIKQCANPTEIYRKMIEESREYSDYELALVNLVRSWLIREEYRVMAVCQFTSVPGRTLHFAKNQLRLKGLEFRSYGNKIMKKVIESTSLSPLSPVFVGSNAILVGKTPEALVEIHKECQKANWLVPLVYVLDARIVSEAEVASLAALPSLDCLYGQTAQILDNAIRGVSQSLDSLPHQLVHSLDHLSTTSDESSQ